MKTFSQFVTLLQEKEIAWNSGKLVGSGKSPSDTAKTKIAQLSRERDPQKIVAAAQRIKRMRGIVAHQDEVAKAKDPKTSRTSGMQTRANTGRASKPADTRGRSGSLPNIASPAGEGSGSRVAGKYGDLRKGSSNNIGSTQINTGRGYTGKKFGKGGNR